MNLSDLRQQTLDNLGDDGATWAPSGASGGEYARLDRIINQAQQELGVIAERVDPTFNVQISDLPISGETWVPTEPSPVNVVVHYYTPMPADFRRLIALWQMGASTTPREVQIVPHRRVMFYEDYTNPLTGGMGYLANRAQSGATGNKTYLYIMGYTLAYQLHYAARLSDLSLDTDVCQLPIEYHHVVALNATVKALLQENGDAGNYKAMYDQAIQTLTAALPRRDGAGAPY